MQGTNLVFLNGVGGIKIPGLIWSELKNLSIYSSGADPDKPSHGLEVSSIVDAQNIVIKGFSGHGVYVHSGVPASNAAMAQFRYIFSKENRGHGFYLEGNDSNGCGFYNCNAMDNGRVGFYDNSFLGNSFYGCMAHNNKPNYKVVRHGVNRATFIGCYSENGELKDEIGSVGYIFGGTWGESGDSYILYDHAKAFND